MLLFAAIATLPQIQVDLIAEPPATSFVLNEIGENIIVGRIVPILIRNKPYYTTL